MTAVFAFLRAHWTKLLPFAVGVAAGWWLHRAPPAPEVHEKLDTHQQAAAQAQQDTKANLGPWTVKTYEWASPCPRGTAKATTAASAANDKPAGAAGGLTVGDIAGMGLAGVSGAMEQGPLVKYTVESHDPATIESHSSANIQSSADSHLDLTIKPAATRQLQLGFEDLPGLLLHRDASSLRVAGRARLFDSRWWGEASMQPLHRDERGAWKPKGGVALAVEF